MRQREDQRIGVGLENEKEIDSIGSGKGKSREQAPGFCCR